MSDRETNQGADHGSFNPDRREFGKMALSGMLGAAGPFGSAGQKVASGGHIAPGIRLCAQSSAKPTDEQLLFLKQIGAAYVDLWEPRGSNPRATRLNSLPLL